MILYIDTTDFNHASFTLKEDGPLFSHRGPSSRYNRVYKISPHHSHDILAKLAGFLKERKIKNGEIKKIVVNKGPGSFTGVRVGAAIAQALGLALNVPVSFRRRG